MLKGTQMTSQTPNNHPSFTGWTDEEIAHHSEFYDHHRPSLEDKHADEIDWAMTLGDEPDSGLRGEA